MELAAPAVFGDAFARQIVRAVRGRLGRGCPDKQWTRTLLVIFREIAENLRADYVVWSSEHGGEFMLDLVWRRSRDCPDLLLGMESEWKANKEEIQNDFEKLMHVKTALKFMIFQTKKGELSIRKRIEELARNLKDFSHHIKGEEYVLLIFPYGGPVEADCHRYIVPNDGKQVEVKFEPLFREKLWD